MINVGGGKIQAGHYGTSLNLLVLDEVWTIAKDKDGGKIGAVHYRTTLKVLVLSSG